MKDLGFKIAFCLLLFGGIWIPTWSQPTTEVDDWQVKAALLAKMVDFIEWPVLHRPQKDVFLIGVYQDNQMLRVLRKVYAERKAKSRVIGVLPIHDEQEMLHMPFDVIWLGRLSETHLRQLLPYLQQSSALIVSDTPGYAQEVSMVNFFESEGKVKFEMNTRILTQKGFVVNFRLLKLAKIVK
ncbi:hypothetical protein FHS56_002234 [Thermonema lapsum]|uniref:YfiR family protein n=1 Tax=Thermonema lapsum TaxID=28195 RepID=A0A846MTP8_9BACT|nr:YfiR family protein [Thermonema lapsum]NIK74702.1 hypothetical protein [Thermonema lapsum]